ncbi:MAG: flavodoxin family protein [Campylobacteraceae bacterium]|nr:flavodoxin family protein [Campylobacteraceae bacterium]
MKKTAIILGTSRSNGNTADLSKVVAKNTDAVIFDINKYNILPFDYEYKNQDDDFLILIKDILTYDNIIFASPVYWFSPSTTMKLFIDRITDLITIEKDLGRQLRGKTTALISTGEYESPKSCFEDVFKHTFEYLGMNYKGMLYCACAFNESAENSGSDLDLNKYLPKVNTFSHMFK